MEQVSSLVYRGRWVAKLSCGEAVTIEPGRFRMDLWEQIATDQSGKEERGCSVCCFRERIDERHLQDK